MKEYNKKAFLLPDNIHSMAAYHAKLFANGEYIFRIHDCITGIRLRGDLKSEKDFTDAANKLITLANGAMDFVYHLETLRMNIYGNEGADEQLREAIETLKEIGV